MLRVGSFRARDCQGVSRREFVRAALAAPFAWGLTRPLGGSPSGSSPRARSILLIWLGAVVMGLCGIGIWGMAPTYLTERFPTIVRGVTLKDAPWSALWPNLLALVDSRSLSLQSAPGDSERCKRGL